MSSDAIELGTIRPKTGGNAGGGGGRVTDEPDDIPLRRPAPMEKQTSLYSSVKKVAYSKQKALKKAYEIKKSRFADWTRKELLDLLVVENEYELRDEFNVELLSMRDLCDELYHDLPMPDKPRPKSMRQMRAVEKGVRKFQDLWLEHRLRKRAAKQQKASTYDPEYGAMLLEEDTFDYTAETLEIDEIHRRLQDHPDYGKGINLDHIEVDVHDGGPPKPGSDKDLRSNLRRKPSLMLARQTQSLLDAPWTPPDHEKAEASRAFSHPRRGGKGGEKYSFRSTTTGRHCMLGGFGEQCDLWEEGFVSEFGLYGPGITNYFKFLKWLIWVSFTWAIISTPLLVTNINNAYNQHESQGFTDLAQTTVGNLAPHDANATISIRLPGCDPDIFGDTNCYLNRDTVGTFYVSLDLAGVLFVFLAFLWLSLYERKEEATLDKNTVYASMFTIAVKGLPRTTNEIELMCHFEKLLHDSFPVVDIEMATQCENEVQQCQNRGDLIRKKIRLIHEHRYDCTTVRAKYSNQQKAENQIQKLRRQFFERVKKLDYGIKKYDEVLLKLSERPERPLAAYITFDESVASLICADLYRPTLYSTLFSDPKLLFKGKKLRVKKAPEPSTILWENLEYGFWKREGRRAVTTALALLLVLLTVFMAASSTMLQTQALNEAGYELCPEGFEDMTEAEQQAAIEADKEILHCYCDQLTHFEQSSNEYCEKYFQDYVQAEVITYFATFVVLVVNTLVENAITAFAEFEKHHSEDSKEISIFTRLFCLKYLNTSLVFLLASNAVVLEKVYSVEADHSNEFTSIWYESVGVTIMMVQLGDLMFSQGRTFFQYFKYHFGIHRAKDNRKIALTQSELNKIYVGPVFKISYRYSQLMSTFFVCLTFNPGMPLLNWIAAANFLIYYFVDKYMFINLYQSPHRFTTKIGREATKMIPFGLAVHCAMGVWVYSNEEMFSNEQTENTLFQEGNSYLGGTISEKLGYKQVLPLFILCLIIVAYFVLNILFKHIRQFLRQMKTYLTGDHKEKLEIQEKLRQARGFGAQVLYKKAVKRNIIKGLASYNILQNPVYKEKFSISWNFAMSHNRVRSVRLTTAQQGRSSFYNDEGDEEQVERMRRRGFSGAFAKDDIRGKGVATNQHGDATHTPMHAKHMASPKTSPNSSPRPSASPSTSPARQSPPQSMSDADREAARARYAAQQRQSKARPQSQSPPRPKSQLPTDKKALESLRREQILAREIDTLERSGTMEPTYHNKR